MTSNINLFNKKKAKKEKISMVTTYDSTMASLVENSNIDAILVGDSLAMVCLGQENTLKVTIDDMIHHSKAVKSKAKNKFMVVDMPFMSYGISIDETLKNASRLIKEGEAQAVKLEGGVEISKHIEALVKSKIPVMGHLGLTPQSINQLGGFKIQCREEESAQKLLNEAKILQESGVFALVLECIPSKVAKQITQELKIATIGIGAGKFCDGQILVLQDLLGMNIDFKPKFVKTYSNLSSEIINSLNKYHEEVSNEVFPNDEFSFKMTNE